MKNFLTHCLWIFISVSLFAIPAESQTKTTVSADLEIIKLSDNVYLHTSYVTYPEFGRVDCNGLILVSEGEALLFDTPPNEPLTEELLDWFSQSHPDVEIKGVVVNHFHNDCLGGLPVIHRMEIPSYGFRLTALLAKENGAVGPGFSFDNTMTLNAGGKRAVCRYFGEGHTADNIIVWLPDEKLLFGGCMIKAINAGKGNLADANLQEWSNTVKQVKKAYDQAALVVPGHGKPGGMELLDYTIALFSEEAK